MAVSPDFPKHTLSDAVRAMIKASTSDEVVTGVALNLLRRDQETRG